MGNLESIIEDCDCSASLRRNKSQNLADIPFTPKAKKDNMGNPQSDFQRGRSSIELLEVLGDSKFKSRGLKTSIYDDAFSKNLITAEQYATKLKGLNLTTLSDDDSE
jgi:hypothetical protein